MKVSYVYRVLYYIIAVLVCFPVADTTLYSATRHPSSKATRVMIASIIFAIIGIEVLSVCGSSEFACEYNQCVIQQAA